MISDVEYIDIRNRLIPKAVEYTNEFVGPEPDEYTARELWTGIWNRTYHKRMNELAIIVMKKVIEQETPTIYIPSVVAIISRVDTYPANNREIVGVRRNIKEAKMFADQYIVEYEGVECIMEIEEWKVEIDPSVYNAPESTQTTQGGE